MDPVQEEGGGPEMTTVGEVNKPSRQAPREADLGEETTRSYIRRVWDCLTGQNHTASRVAAVSASDDRLSNR